MTATTRQGRRPDLHRIDEGLKGFQRATVDFVFRRFYLDAPAADRFLVADEVGLGKTVVARAVLARAINLLWDATDRIDIVYVCSNSSIARQNIERLKEGLGIEAVPEADRLTLLPSAVQELDRQKVNLIAFTPGTSFEFGSSLGEARERVLLYQMLEAIWDITGTGPMNLLQGGVVNHHTWRVALRERRPIEHKILDTFRAKLDSDVELRARFDEACERFKRARKNSRRPAEDRELRNRIIAKLRHLLAASCLQALQPEFIILDEFQRFRQLLDVKDVENSAAQLANELFTYSSRSTRAKVLLLSATPYRMFTGSDEVDENHYADFLKTVEFLSTDRVITLEGLLRDYRNSLLTIGARDQPSARLHELKSAIESELRAVMTRTERLATSGGRHGMLKEKVAHLVPTATDLRSFVGLDAVAATVKEPGAMSYWKSAPYTLTFMDDYKLKRSVVAAVADGDPPGQLDGLSECALLTPDELEHLQRVDPRNARLRELEDQTVGSGAWRLLWIPPSAPYYRLRGAYGDQVLKNFTKRLVFSGWRVVPKSVSALLSYEAKRRITLAFERAGGEAGSDVQLLRFATTRGRRTGLPVFSLIYPSLTLTADLDPLLLSRPQDGHAGPVSASSVLAAAEARVKTLLDAFNRSRRSPASGKGERADQRWYWALPMLLDAQHKHSGIAEWWSSPTLVERWTGGDRTSEETKAFTDHLSAARQLVLSNGGDLGSQPADLVRVVALIGLAGPATCALRALRRESSKRGQESAYLDAAASVGWAFRTLFNLPEVQSVVRTGRAARYWQQVLIHCFDGGLQAVLDEYVHLLREQRAPFSDSQVTPAPSIAADIRIALQLRAPTMTVNNVGPSSEPMKMTARFARRLVGDVLESGEVQRETDIRAAFNSPFWPFVLISTSIGQEGLDFHPYCHAVVHWDLPSNPVDLEQREGRVHRYKGHAVRKNVAARHWAALFADAQLDPWNRLFTAANGIDPDASAGLVPFWLYTAGRSGAFIERHVFAYALSKDIVRLRQLKRSLVLYRLAFGQPRQEDLVEFLVQTVPERTAEKVVGDLRINLTPPAGT